MSDPRALELFEKCGVLVRGSHLVYTSGRHGAEYVNKDALYPLPEIISELCARIAERFRSENVEVVLAPALGGIILSQWIAHHLHRLTGRSIPALFAEKAETPEGFVLKRGYEKQVQGKRTLVVEDILTTGGSVKKVVALARKLGAQPIAVAALCNRGGVTAAEIDAPALFNLTEFSLQSWAADDCPLCRQGVPINQSLGKGGSAKRS